MGPKLCPRRSSKGCCHPSILYPQNRGARLVAQRPHSSTRYQPAQATGKAPSNFALTLPPPQSDLAREILKDPYIFKPAPLDESATERALEKALLDRLRDFLIEMGAGFAFVGNQYRLEVDGDEFFLDMLFYHTRLHCYVVIDLQV